MSTKTGRIRKHLVQWRLAAVPAGVFLGIPGCPGNEPAPRQLPRGVARPLAQGPLCVVCHGRTAYAPATRCVEMNPLRAGLTRKPWTWKWSSAAAGRGRQSGEGFSAFEARGRLGVVPRCARVGGRDRDVAASRAHGPAAWWPRVRGAGRERAEPRATPAEAGAQEEAAETGIMPPKSDSSSRAHPRSAFAVARATEHQRHPA